ncbi:cuticle protein 19-like [Sitophilus oryzae]|uniref:Cuticle protein 19-like n=1 Tax=Sitophilus oryzae TaxID=7048 RepID=A0A6J2X2V8_SITOR|nr:cuticle protein 19-like [Sitophilus oryzae]
MFGVILGLLVAMFTVNVDCGAVSYSYGGIRLGSGYGYGGLRLEPIAPIKFAAPLAYTAPIPAPYYGYSKAIDYYTPPKYEYKYAVGDPKTGDQKEQTEERYGDVVKGEYSLAEPDGTIRVVKYTADKVNGFNAEVSRIGKSYHPERSYVTKGYYGGGLGYKFY